METHTFELHQIVKAATNSIWYNLIKEGKEGEIVKIHENGCNVYFSISPIWEYQRQIFFVRFDQIKPA